MYIIVLDYIKNDVIIKFIVNSIKEKKDIEEVLKILGYDIKNISWMKISEKQIEKIIIRMGKIFNDNFDLIELKE